MSVVCDLRQSSVRISVTGACKKIRLRKLLFLVSISTNLMSQIILLPWRRQIVSFQHAHMRIENRAQCINPLLWLSHRRGSLPVPVLKPNFDPAVFNEKVPQFCLLGYAV